LQSQDLEGIPSADLKSSSLMKVLEYIRKPYPVIQNKWALILIISLFISFFLVLFQPFGLQTLESGKKILLLAGYGLVTFIILLINLRFIPFVVPELFREEKWTVFREILLVGWILITITAGNYLYSVLLHIVPWKGASGFFIFTGFTLAVAFIPVIGVIVISHNALLRKNLQVSRELNQLIRVREGAAPVDDQELLITSENRHQKIAVPAPNLICIESEGNYVTVWFVEKGMIRRRLIRSTLTNVEQQVREAENIFKCHRAFIINQSHVKKVSGNSQGYRLRLRFLDREIPVARNYSKSFREALIHNP
jgi:hypothetical protein